MTKEIKAEYRKITKFTDKMIDKVTSINQVKQQLALERRAVLGLLNCIERKPKLTPSERGIKPVKQKAK